MGELEPSYNQLAEQGKRLPLHDQYIYIILYLVLYQPVIIGYIYIKYQPLNFFWGFTSLDVHYIVKGQVSPEKNIAT